MGNSFSSTEYREQIVKFSKDFLTSEDNATLANFLMQSEDFYNVFTNSLLDDYRKIKQEKVDNLIYIMSFVSPALYIFRPLSPCMI
jgi:hypothetical protein